LTAAALFFTPWLIVALLNGDLHGWWIAMLVACAAAFVLHVRLQPEHASRAALWLVLTQGAVLVGLVGVVIEIVATDSCGGGLAAKLVRWIGAGVIYLGLGAWGLQRPLRGLWALPLAAIVAGGWLVAAAELVPGGTTVCFN
jgi:FtsH-binding integral membrane protein